MKLRPIRLMSGLVLLALAGCQTSKSSTPTAPTVAGPIPGVNISAPGMLEPLQGFKFKESEQPIRLVVQNATTNGVRPLVYTFEVSGDSSFSSKVYSRSNVPPGENNKTSVQIDRLEIGRAYFWRAWAEDGANTGAIASSAADHPGTESAPRARESPTSSAGWFVAWLPLDSSTTPAILTGAMGHRR